MFNILSSKKQCTKCWEWKDRSEFHKRKASKDGLSYKCKECNGAGAQAWSLLHPGAVWERVKAWRADNPGLRAQNERECRAKNIEKAREADRARYKRNPFPAKKAALKWNSANPDTMKDIKHRRRAKERDVIGGHFTELEWRNLLDKYSHRCLCCGRSDVPLERDHVIPIGPPHSDEISNIQPLCRSCNASKGAKVIDYR